VLRGGAAILGRETSGGGETTASGGALSSTEGKAEKRKKGSKGVFVIF
jgi:hypothetical protein